jgi:formamidopyrimidine-DNA glycosylase
VPELPEVETVRRGLAAHVVGRRVVEVRIGRERSVRRTGPDEAVRRLTGAVISGARRHGKYLQCPLDTGDALMVHLRMSGQLLLAPVGAPLQPHTHVVAVLEANDSRPAEELRFVDPRTFGEFVVYDEALAGDVVPELARLGPDPLTAAFDRSVVARALSSTRRGVKALLLDQTRIAGIGNIYADEILHRARIAPTRPAETVSPPRVTLLHRCIGEVLEQAVGAGGSTLSDAQYVDLMGVPGSFQHAHRVVGRAGERCGTCRRGRIRRAVVAGRGTVWCPVCQR